MEARLVYALQEYQQHFGEDSISKALAAAQKLVTSAAGPRSSPDRYDEWEAAWRLEVRLWLERLTHQRTLRGQLSTDGCIREAASLPNPSRPSDRISSIATRVLEPSADATFPVRCTPYPSPMTGSAGYGMLVDRLLEDALSLRREVKQLCHHVYQDLYHRLVLEERIVAGQKEDENTPTVTRHAPLCSMVVEYDGESEGASPQHIVVGCDDLQLNYIINGPLSYVCGDVDEPFSDDRGSHGPQHCTIYLLHPSGGTLDLLRQPGREDDGDTLTSIVYDLSEAHVTLRSLLGLAMQVWSTGDPHVVAQVRDLEATSPWRVYPSETFWQQWSVENLPHEKEEGNGAAEWLPVPLLPGEVIRR